MDLQWREVLDIGDFQVFAGLSLIRSRAGELVEAILPGQLQLPTRLVQVLRGHLVLSLRQDWAVALSL
jgi:hypothetical protein